MNYVMGFIANYKQVNYTLCNELLTISHLSCSVSIKGKIGSDTTDLIFRSSLNCVDGLQNNLYISRIGNTQNKINMPILTTPQRLRALMIPLMEGIAIFIQHFLWLISSA